MGLVTTSSNSVHDYTKYFNLEIMENFEENYQIHDIIKEDMYLVQFHSDNPIGAGRSLKYWTTTDEANKFTSIEDIKDRLALLNCWGDRNMVTIAKVPKGAKVKYAIGTTSSKDSVNEFRPGGAVQLLFTYFNEAWIIKTNRIV